MIARFQGGVRERSAALAEEGTELASAFRDGRAVVHAGGHRCAPLDRRAQPRDSDNDEMLFAPAGAVSHCGLKAPLPELDELDGEDAA